jgi:hypothetical protein
MPSLPAYEAFMIFRLLSTASLTMSLAVMGADVHAQAAPVTMPAIPSHNCVKPEFPGNLGSNTKITAFNKAYTAYGECIKKYIADTKAMANAAIDAGNTAVEEFNKFVAEIKAETEAAKN